MNARSCMNSAPARWQRSGAASRFLSGSKRKGPAAFAAGPNSSAPQRAGVTVRGVPSVPSERPAGVPSASNFVEPSSSPLMRNSAQARSRDANRNPSSRAAHPARQPVPTATSRVNHRPARRDRGKGEGRPSGQYCPPRACRVYPTCDDGRLGRRPNATNSTKSSS
jgi:hypothetical protein